METNKASFLMLVGLPASGKSTFSEELMEGRDDIVLISSDSIRKELFGDEDEQGNNTIVFETMAKRTKESLKNGIHVIYDATNLNRKRRRGILQQLPKGTSKSVVYMATDYKLIHKQNMHRNRVVPTHVIENMYKNLQIPIYSEGWDKITIIYDDETLNSDLPKQFTDAVRAEVLFNREGMELMNFFATYFDEFFKIYELGQDSKWHSLSVHRHTYYVYKHVLDNYETEDETEKELMLWTALLHDTGKAIAKSFVNFKGEETRYANFIGHEFVSSQIAVNLLQRMGFDKEFIHQVATLTQFHMYLLDDKASKQKLISQVGEDLYKKLEFLRDADTLAH